MDSILDGIFENLGNQINNNIVLINEFFEQF